LLDDIGYGIVRCSRFRQNRCFLHDIGYAIVRRGCNRETLALSIVRRGCYTLALALSHGASCFIGALVDVFPFTSVCNLGWSRDTLSRQVSWCEVNFTQDQLLRRDIRTPFAVKPELYHQPPRPDSSTVSLVDEGEKLAAADAAAVLVHHGLGACLGVPALPSLGFDRSRLARAAKAFRPHRREEVPRFLAVDGARRKILPGELRRVHAVDVGVMDEVPCLARRDPREEVRADELRLAGMTCC
jgi:hypothetical protein